MGPPRQLVLAPRVACIVMGLVSFSGCPAQKPAAGETVGDAATNVDAGGSSAEDGVGGGVGPSEQTGDEDLTTPNDGGAAAESESESDGGTSSPDESQHDETVPEAPQETPDGGGGSPPPSATLPMAPLAQCAPTTGCGGPAVAAVFSVTRADFFYPLGPGVSSPEAFGTDDAPTYPEANLPDPSAGRRLTITGRALVSGALLPDETAPTDRPAAAFLVELNGRPGSAWLDEQSVDWIRVWPSSFAAGDPLWIMLHSRSEAFLEGNLLDVVVPSTAGVALDAAVIPAITPVPLTAVSTTADLSTLLVHLRNEDAAAHTITRVVVNGEDVTAHTCLPSTALGSGRATLLSIRRCSPFAPGDPWTVAVEFDDAPPAVGAGRIAKPVYPVHTWPEDADCPFPGIRDEAFAAYRAQGFDTFFARRRYRNEAECSDRFTSEAIEQDFAAAGAWAMPDDFGMSLVDTSRVPARLLGDEVDDKSFEELVASQKMRRIAEETNARAQEEPDVMTYIGGSRHRFTGMFAGAADLQGMDMYVAACAPHITDGGRHPPLRGSYDYLRATQRNQRPNSTWLYTQGLGNWPAQPTPSEFRVQALSVVAAGAHGFMTFQGSLRLAADVPDTWAEMKRVNHDVAALGPWLRQAAPTGLARVVAGRAIVEALRVPEGLVLVVIGLDTDQEATELACGLLALEDDLPPWLQPSYQPWVLASQLLDVAVQVPAELGVESVLELRDQQLIDRAGWVHIEGHEVQLRDVPLDDETAGRIFLLVGDPQWSTALTQRLSP
ncbi:MAG: hypothetical protein ACO3JL_00945 [Myxococcota bacterium]